MNDFLKNKWVLTALVIMVIAIIVWIVMWNGGSSRSRDVQVDQQVASIENEASGADGNTDENSAVSQEGYFFVKEADGAVNIYRYEGDEKELYRTTDIEFSLLSTEDQELLKTGIQLENEQELANFLENFDS